MFVDFDDDDFNLDSGPLPISTSASTASAWSISQIISKISSNKQKDKLDGLESLKYFLQSLLADFDTLQKSHVLSPDSFDACDFDKVPPLSSSSSSSSLSSSSSSSPLAATMTAEQKTKRSKLFHEPETMKQQQQQKNKKLGHQEAFKIIDILVNILVIEEHGLNDKRKKTMSSTTTATLSGRHDLPITTTNRTTSLVNTIRLCIQSVMTLSHLKIEDLSKLLDHIVAFFCDAPRHACGSPFSFDYLKLLCWLLSSHRHRLSFGEGRWISCIHICRLVFKSSMPSFSSFFDGTLAQLTVLLDTLKASESVSSIGFEEALGLQLCVYLSHCHFFSKWVQKSLYLVLIFFEFFVRHANESSFHAKILVRWNFLLTRLLQACPSLAYPILSSCYATIIKLYPSKNPLVFSEVLYCLNICMDVSCVSKRICLEGFFVEALIDALTKDLQKTRKFSRVFSSATNARLLELGQESPHLFQFYFLTMKVALYHGPFFTDLCDMLFSKEANVVKEPILCVFMLMSKVMERKEFKALFRARLEALFSMLYTLTDPSVLSHALLLCSACVRLFTKDELNVDPEAWDKIWRFAASKVRVVEISYCAFYFLGSLVNEGIAPSLSSLKSLSAEFLAYFIHCDKASLSEFSVVFGFVWHRFLDTRFNMSFFEKDGLLNGNKLALDWIESMPCQLSFASLWSLSFLLFEMALPTTRAEMPLSPFLVSYQLHRKLAHDSPLCLSSLVSDFFQNVAPLELADVKAHLMQGPHGAMDQVHEEQRAVSFSALDLIRCRMLLSSTDLFWRDHGVLCDESSARIVAFGDVQMDGSRWKSYVVMLHTLLSQLTKDQLARMPPSRVLQLYRMVLDRCHALLASYIHVAGMQSEDLTDSNTLKVDESVELVTCSLQSLQRLLACLHGDMQEQACESFARLLLSIPLDFEMPSLSVDFSEAAMGLLIEHGHAILSLKAPVPALGVSRAVRILHVLLKQKQVWHPAALSDLYEKLRVLYHDRKLDPLSLDCFSDCFFTYHTLLEHKAPEPEQLGQHFQTLVAYRVFDVSFDFLLRSSLYDAIAEGRLDVGAVLALFLPKDAIESQYLASLFLVHLCGHDVAHFVSHSCLLIRQVKNVDVACASFDWFYCSLKSHLLCLSSAAQFDSFDSMMNDMLDPLLYHWLESELPLASFPYRYLSSDETLSWIDFCHGQRSKIVPLLLYFSQSVDASARQILHYFPACQLSELYTEVYAEVLAVALPLYFLGKELASKKADLILYDQLKAIIGSEKFDRLFIQEIDRVLACMLSHTFHPSYQLTLRDISQPGSPPPMDAFLQDSLEAYARARTVSRAAHHRPIHVHYDSDVIFSTFQHISRLVGLRDVDGLLSSTTRTFKLLFYILESYASMTTNEARLRWIYILNFFMTIWGKPSSLPLPVLVTCHWLLNVLRSLPESKNDGLRDELTASFLYLLKRYYLSKSVDATLDARPPSLSEFDMVYLLLPAIMDMAIRVPVNYVLLDKTVDLALSMAVSQKSKDFLMGARDLTCWFCSLSSPLAVDSVLNERQLKLLSPSNVPYPKLRAVLFPLLTHYLAVHPEIRVEMESGHFSHVVDEHGSPSFCPPVVTVNAILDRLSTMYYNGKARVTARVQEENIYFAVYEIVMPLLSSSDVAAVQTTLRVFKNIYPLIADALGNAQEKLHKTPFSLNVTEDWKESWRQLGSLFKDAKSSLSSLNKEASGLGRHQDILELSKASSTRASQDWSLVLYGTCLKELFQLSGYNKRKDVAFYLYLLCLLEMRPHLAKKILPYLIQELIIGPVSLGKACATSSLASTLIAYLEATLEHILDSASAPRSMRTEIAQTIVDILGFSFSRFYHLHHNDWAKVDVLSFFRDLNIHPLLLSRSWMLLEQPAVALYFYEMHIELHGEPDARCSNLLFGICSGLTDKDSFDALPVKDEGFLFQRFFQNRDYGMAFSFLLSNEHLGLDSKEAQECIRGLGLDSLLQLPIPHDGQVPLARTEAVHRMRAWDLDTLSGPPVDLQQVSIAIDSGQPMAIDAMVQSVAHSVLDSLSVSHASVPFRQLAFLRQTQELTKPTLDYDAWWARKKSLVGSRDYAESMGFLNVCFDVAMSLADSMRSDTLARIGFESRLSQVSLARKRGAFQISINFLSQLKSASKKLPHAEFQISYQESKNLWARGKQELAISWFKSCMVSDASRHWTAEQRLRGVSRLAKWLDETKGERPSFILQEYYEAAIAQTKVSSLVESQLSGKIHFQMAKFCDAQYQIRSTSTDLETKHTLLQHKSVEIEECAKKVSLARSEKEKTVLQRTLQSLVTQNDLDRKEYEIVISDANVYLVKAVENYLKTLEIVSDGREDPAYTTSAVFKLVSLWFGHAEYAHMNEMMKAHLDFVPSYRLLPLMYQLAARLDVDDGAGSRMYSQVFGSTLLRLIHRMATDHPYHTLYQIFALRNSANGPTVEKTNKRKVHSHQTANDASSDYRRSLAAERMLSQLKLQSPRLKLIVEDIDALCSAYIELASKEISQATLAASHSSDFCLRGFLISSLRDLSNVPVPTAELAIDRSCSYPPGSLISIAKFGSTFKLIGGINLPKVIDCTGSDGRLYRQLVKSRDDLRQDAVMVQIFSLFDSMLKKSSSCRERNLSVRTYKVIPLQPLCGLLEWVQSTLPIGDYLTAAHERLRPGDLSVAEARATMKREFESSTSTPGSKLHTFETEILPKFRPVFRYFFWEHFAVADVWYARRLSFCRSFAVSCMLGYIVGLGDRHCQNMLIDKSTADLIQIDLNLIFEQGRLLRVPERVPFRLTQDLIDAMGPAFRMEGPFRRACEETLGLLREKADLFLTLLEVFKHDPLYRWTVNPVKAERFQKKENLLKTLTMAYQAQNTNSGEESPAYPTADQSALGTHSAFFTAGPSLAPTVHPSHGTGGAGVGGGRPVPLFSSTPAHVAPLETSRSFATNPEAERSLIKVREKLSGIEEGSTLSVKGQVSALIGIATNHELLCQMYPGWQPWM